MTTPNEIITLAKTQIGVKEKPAGTNKVKYNSEYYGQEVYDGLWGTTFAWCCVFIWWLCKHAGAGEMYYGGKKTASCTVLMNYYKREGKFSKTPRVGSFAFYNWGKGSTAKHIGLVTKINADGSFVAIEGNTAIGNDSNGGEVMERTRYMSQTLGFAYPYVEGATKVNITLNTLKNGSKGENVKALQILLNGYGFNCGEVDGAFGSKTLTALKQFQSKNGLTADGIAGAKTWAKLLK